MRQTVIAILQSLGLMPYAYRIKMLAQGLRPTAWIRNLQFWFGGNRETLLIPGFWARLLVAGSADIPGFLASGRHGFDCIRETLERNGRPIESLTDVLDFGCGCGRVLRHWNGYPDKRIHGTDMNGYLVEECRRCVPFARVSKDTLDGKVAYADQSFDLVYAFSVFTHLDLDAQKSWLGEFHRILRPNGILLLTVHGRAYSERLTDEEREQFNSGRPVVRLAQYPGGNLCVTFHPESYVRESLSEGFEIVDAIPEGAKGSPRQDLYVLRRVN